MHKRLLDDDTVVRSKLAKPSLACMQSPPGCHGMLHCEATMPMLRAASIQLEPRPVLLDMINMQRFGNPNGEQLPCVLM
jgi:hypothetical protein